MVRHLVDFPVAFLGNGDDRRLTGLDFLQVADGLGIDIGLRGEDDDGDAFDNQGQGAVFQFAGRIGFGVNIGNFLQFQGAFQGYAVIQAASQEEGIFAGTVAFREDLDLFRVFQHGVDLFRNLPHVVRQGPCQFIGQLAAQTADIDAQHEHDDELRRIGLGGCHGDFRAGIGVDHLVGFAGDGGTDDVGHGQRAGAQAFCLAQGGQRVARFAGLADDDHQAAGINQRIAIAEFAGNVRLHRDAGEFFQVILAYEAGMVGRAAGDDEDLPDAAQVGFRPVQFRERDFPVFLAQTAAHGFPDGFRLFVNLLQHEMFETAFFGCFRIPGDVVDLLVDGVAVQVLDLDGILRDDGDFAVAHDVRAARMPDDGRNIGGDEVFPVAEADDQRIILLGADQFVRFVGAHEDQRIGTVDLAQDFLDGAQEVAVVLVRHQVCHDFRIRVGGELVALLEQIFL